MARGGPLLLLLLLQEAEVAEKAAVRSLELKVAQQAKQRELLERAERDVDSVLAVQAEVDTEQGRLRDAQRQLKETAERASRDDAERNDAQHQIRGHTQRVQLAKERNERLVEQHASKQAVAAQGLADTRAQAAAVEAERTHASRQLEDNESRVRELRDRLLRGRMEHEAEVASVQQQQQLLAAQVRAYHADLTSAMKTVSAANAVLVS